VRILIDGYNLIRAVPELAALDREDLSAGREALVTRLLSYRATRGHSLAIVFDGASLHPSAKWGNPGGIAVVFSRGGRSADDLLAEKCRAGEADILVTSDQGLSARVDRAVEVVGSREFWERVELAHAAALKGGEEEEEGPNPDRGAPGKRLSKRERSRLRARERL